MNQNTIILKDAVSVLQPATGCDICDDITTIDLTNKAEKILFPLLRGEIFRGLKIHNILGNSDVSTTYLVSHNHLKLPMVLKCYDLSKYGDCFGEAVLASRLHSRHIVRIFDGGIEKNFFWLVEEYVDGLDAMELIRWFNRLQRRPPSGLVVSIACQILSGLLTCHASGVIHCDIKPANIFFSGDGTTLVGDFGISVEEKNNISHQHLIGTPQYMAPEQWLGERLHFSTDVYAAGISIYYMLTGRLPFSASSLEEYKYAHLHGLFSDEIMKTDNLDRNLLTIIASLVQKEAKRRPQDIRNLIDQLQPFLDDDVKISYSYPTILNMGLLQVVLLFEDAATIQADVIVNAAHWSMSMRSGVASALRLRGGDEIEQQAMKNTPVDLGSVVWTGAGTLPAKRVAHAVAALDGAICLQRCLLRVFFGAESQEMASIVLPALGSGNGGVPMTVVVRKTLEVIHTFALTKPQYLRTIYVPIIDGTSGPIWIKHMQTYRPNPPCY